MESAVTWQKWIDRNGQNVNRAHQMVRMWSSHGWCFSFTFVRNGKWWKVFTLNRIKFDSGALHPLKARRNTHKNTDRHYARQPNGRGRYVDVIVSHSMYVFYSVRFYVSQSVRNPFCTSKHTARTLPFSFFGIYPTKGAHAQHDLSNPFANNNFSFTYRRNGCSDKLLMKSACCTLARCPKHQKLTFVQYSISMRCAV